MMGVSRCYVSRRVNFALVNLTFSARVGESCFCVLVCEAGLCRCANYYYLFFKTGLTKHLAWRMARAVRLVWFEYCTTYCMHILIVNTGNNLCFVRMRRDIRDARCSYHDCAIYHVLR